ncbi:AraC family transcriptional regulator [Flammeovirga sp. EKP202]|uniref:helix-turn-helix domain-containing protein n=1 Tax=Flammeovirga sp. EKP202 TaxID=2770592 RepID=UPI00165FBA3F|nr:AraC family transcriptional regulator [Flammeovirga sp. EKP202]MBD0400043.1 helix-turn-helix transcriptional regulator [Flammeovirga sp. EKP202]
MKVFNFKEGSMKGLITQLQERVGGVYHKQKYTNNNEALKVKIKYFQLHEGIEVSVNSYVFSEDVNIQFQGDVDNQRYICFRFAYTEDIVKSKISELPNISPSGGMIVYDTSVSTEINIKKGLHYQWVGVRIKKDIIDNEEHLFKEFFGDIFSNEKGQEWLIYDTIPLEIHILLKDIFNIKESKPLIVQNSLLVGKASEMLSIFYDRILSRKHKITSKNLHSEDFEQLMKVKDFILSSLDYVPSLDELAELYGYSISKLRRDFQQVFGTSVIKFHLNYRLEKAKILLATESNNIQNISRACGFKSSSKFSFYFKKKYNMTPKEVAKRYQGNLL